MPAFRLPAFLQPLNRSPERQQAVDRETGRMALYHFPLCTHCWRVRRVIKHMKLQIELRNPSSRSAWRQELIEQGGKLQVPCLQIRHPDYTEWLYESKDIISFLKIHFSR